MAEACRLGNSNIECKTSNNQDENFCIIHVLCVFISLVTILADLTTDIIVFAEYSKDGHFYWALATLIFIITPNILINIFSMRWYISDQKSILRYWISHLCLVGLLERYIIFLRKIFICKNLESIKTEKLICQRNDLSLLHFLYVFIGTMPQIILQIYAIIMLEENYDTKVFALTASIASVIWGCATYIYTITAFSNENFNWNSLFLKLTWHFGMLIGRTAGILLFSIIFGIWTLVPLGVHWLAMTFWILMQKTTFCPNKLEETLYNIVMGFIYCFCYINICEGHTRYRLMLFNTLMVSQNFGSLFLYVLIVDSQRQRKSWSIAAAICILLGTVIGISAMVLYYRYFHSTGPILWKSTPDDIELNNKVIIQKSKNTRDQGNVLNHVRSFKTSRKNETSEVYSSNDTPADQIQKQENENADKKFLLDHWIARSGSPTFTSAPIGNNSMDASSVELYTVENTPQTIMHEDDQKHKMLKKRICSPTELTLKLTSIENIESSIDEITSSNLNLHKRRGICSSDELRDELTKLNLDVCNIVSENFMKIIKTDSSEMSHDTDGSNKKTSSDSIDMDLDLSFSDINSSDINTFNENIVQKLCLSALKNIKVGNQDADIENIQRIALDILKEMYAKKDKNKNGVGTDLFPSKSRELYTPTEILSVHDYENICAVNIAREAWGLRSWNGYCDIENWLHDGSVVRDRRRDTLTSGSSEISSCVSQDLKNAMIAAPPFPKKPHTYSNVFVKFDRTNQDDYANTLCQDDTFLAKPCMTEIGKDPNHLEPIMEELDDLGDIDPSSKKRLNSESSLVATIDEIRKSTVTNSPRNVYHRREHLWDSPQLFKNTTKMDSTLKQALWKEPSKFDSSNIMEPLPEKEKHVINMSQRSKFGSIKKELNTTDTSTSSDSHYEENAFTIYNKNTRRRQKSNSGNLKAQSKKNNVRPDPQNRYDLLNRDIDLLWQLVSENSAHLSSTEDCSSNKMSSSLQSLIQNDTPIPVVNTPSSKISNIKKGVRSKPRRKFSILRERFEPQINLNSDEEMLYRSCENVVQQTDLVVNVENQFAEMDNAIIPQTLQHGRISSYNNDENLTTTTNEDLIMSKNVKEKRSLFMKQVLSPPKFNTKLRHKV